MSDMDDCSSGQELAINAARKLNKINPNHELLNLFNFGGKGCDEKKFEENWENFQVRFGKPGASKEERGTSPGQAYFWAQYYLALEKALDEKAKYEPMHVPV